MKLGDMLQQCLEGEIAAGRAAAVLDPTLLELCFAPRTPGSSNPATATPRHATPQPPPPRPAPELRPMPPAISSPPPESLPPRLHPAPAVRTPSQDLGRLDTAALLRLGNGCALCRRPVDDRRAPHQGLAQPAKLMIIVDPSGRDEEAFANPFAGEAGSLLESMIVKGLKLPLNQVFVCVGHRCSASPKGFAEEARDLLPVLERQLELTRPEAVIVFGVAGLWQIFGQIGIHQNRGRWMNWQNVPLIATLPPSHLIRVPEDKRLVWDDLKMVNARFGR
ncbi:MAG: hypothetical protein RL095_3497 [Verrucomicrobiota bacterium]|jgi:DNA polymerase